MDRFIFVFSLSFFFLFLESWTKTRELGDLSAFLNHIIFFKKKKERD